MQPPSERAIGIAGFISEFEFAARLGVQIQTVRRWRRQRYGPSAVAVGKRLYYRENAAQTFAAEQAEAAPRHRGRPRKGARDAAD
jgi:hypothetical protein